MAASFIAVATIAVYANSLTGPFIFDDNSGIVANEYLRKLWPIPANLWAPYRSTLSGRPILGLSFAINYAIGGLSVRGYHITNMVIHAMAALLLFGIVRRTLLTPRTVGRFGPVAVPIAFAAALLWAVHPLQTQSVTYVIQRAESLTGMLYLATLYFFILGVSTSRPGWLIVSIAACLAGMAVKEVMVTAPLVVLLYDAVFFNRSWAAGTKRRRFYLAGLFATWGVLIALMLSWPRASSAGFSVRELTPLAYLVNQPAVILHYLWLTVWPVDLCLDYGWKAAPLREVLFPLILVSLIFVTALVLLFRRPMLGFLLAAFFIILAPTSSFVPIRDLAFEHRMYLPLAVVCVLAVLGLAHGLSIGPPDQTGATNRIGILLAIVLLTAGALGMTTVARNRQYASDLAIWNDVVAKRPTNHRGYVGIGLHYAGQRDLTTALAHFNKAMELYPDSRHAHFCAAATLMDLGRPDEALPHAQKAVELEPDLYEDRNLLGVLLNARARHEEAAAQFAEALRLKPDSGAGHLGLARAQVRLRKFDEAATHYQRAIELGFQADFARIELGDLLIQLRLYENAARIYEESLRLNPNQPMVLNRLGFALLKMNRAEEAAEALKAALAADPKIAPARFNYADALAALQRYDEALREYEEARRLKPDLPRLAERIAEVRRRRGDAPPPGSAPSNQDPGQP